MPRAFAFAVAALVSACMSQSAPSEARAFERWLAADASRVPSFERFRALLEREGVADVLPVHELWLSDRLAPECVVEPFVAPPEDLWTNIVPALRFVRDFVEPAIGDVTVASAYRDLEFNACVRGASQSAHREFLALDLMPRGSRVSRNRLIETLCPIHAAEGERYKIGLGIYRARRFHIDARNFRGWGEDFRRSTFPCDARAEAAPA